MITLGLWKTNRHGACQRHVALKIQQVLAGDANRYQ
jgi:hypothetical protein